MKRWKITLFNLLLLKKKNLLCTRINGQRTRNWGIITTCLRKKQFVLRAIKLDDYNKGNGLKYFDTFPRNHLNSTEHLEIRGVDELTTVLFLFKNQIIPFQDFCFSTYRINLFVEYNILNKWTKNKTIFFTFMNVDIIIINN